MTLSRPARESGDERPWRKTAAAGAAVTSITRQGLWINDHGRRREPHPQNRGQSAAVGWKRPATSTKTPAIRYRPRRNAAAAMSLEAECDLPWMESFHLRA